MSSSLDALSRLPYDELRNLFDKVTKIVSAIPADHFVGSDQDKLRLYGLYKHVHEGPCPKGTAPSIFQVVARSKFTAYESCRDLSRNEAMVEYVIFAYGLDDSTKSLCHKTIEEYTAHGKAQEEEETNKVLSISKESDEVLSADTKTTEYISDLAEDDYSMTLVKGEIEGESVILTIFHFFYGMIASLGISLCHYLDIRPLIPRGRLDISYRDLFFVIWQSCLWWKETEYHCHEISRQVRDTWGDEGAMVGLSVRTLLDSYLSLKNFQPGSEIIVVPPITVPGMIRVLGFHNLQIIPIDLKEGDSQWIDIDRIKDAITSKTVAVMVVHPFGMIAASTEQFEELRTMTSDANIELWEDCAECFVGLSEKDRFLGYAEADVRFFSFGLIKTSTALAGGVAVFHDVGVRKDIGRLQSLLHVQPPKTLMLRAILALVLNFVADSPWRVGTLAKLCTWIGVEFDTVVTNSLRGFNISHHPDRRVVEVDLIRQIRKRPSRALLSLVLRRLQQSTTQMPPSVQTRLRQCASMERILSQTKNASLLTYGKGLQKTFWAFPIRCDERDRVSRKLVSMGFDVVSGASQLCCVSRFTGTPCPQAQCLMDTILYVPITSQTLHPLDLKRLADALSFTCAEDTDKDDSHPKELGKANPSGMSKSMLISVTSFLMFLLLRLSPTNPLLVLGFTSLSLVWCICVGAVLAVIYSYVLQYVASDLYLKGSTAFAANCDMIDAATSDQPNFGVYVGSGNRILSKMEVLRVPEALPQQDGRTIVLTGATGFVGSMLLRDLLLERHKLGIEKFIVISRGKKTESAESRILQLLGKPMFSFVTDEEKRQLVVVLNGDVSLPSAGLSPEDLDCIIQDLSISHVFHCAAVVGFTQDLPSAAKANISSALAMQSIAAKCCRKDIRFVHISTAFVHGGHCGSIDSPLSEELFPMGSFDAGEVYRSMLGTQFYASRVMSELGFPNSYTLSKCICEHLLVRQRSVETLIIRPSIVGPAVEAPFEGWAGEKPSTIVGGACLHLLNKWNLWYIESNPVCHIPVDVLSRFIIAKAMESQKDDFTSSEVSSTSDGSFAKISPTTLDSCSESDESSSTCEKESLSSSDHQIFNATWDATFHSDTFTWMDFCCSYLQLGCVLGYFDRSLALLTLVISAKVMPRLCCRDGVYEWVHNTFVRAPVVVLLRILERLSMPTKDVEKLLSVIDLPLLFFPFVRRTYHFRSELAPPCTFDAKRYGFSIAVAAHRFLSKRSSKASIEKPENLITKTYIMGGKKCRKIISDCWMALSLPKGSLSTRLSAFVFAKILRGATTAVTVDLPSFRTALSSINATEGERCTLVFAPTHRSIFDFILLSYMMFVVPELQLDIPYIIAADDFKRLPFFGWFLERLRALFIRRGHRRQDPELIAQISNLKRDVLHIPGSSLEVFLEGQRSRDRRYLVPKTGVLKCLRESGGKHIVVPVVINYERIPEQSTLCREACEERQRLGISLHGLFAWLRDAYLGRIHLGRIHIVASQPVSLDCETRDHFDVFAQQIQRLQKEKTVLSEFHVSAAAKLLDLPNDVVRHGLAELGSVCWPCCDQEIPPMPTDRSELMSIVLHAAHLLAPMFQNDRPLWATWLDSSRSHSWGSPDYSHSTDISALHDALLHHFDQAESLVLQSVKALESQGFLRTETSHIVQVAETFNSSDVPAILIRAAVHFHRQDRRVDEINDPKMENYISPIQTVEINSRQERLGFWGFSDSGFVVKSARGRRAVTMTGNRYKLCGKSLTKIIPFIEAELGVEINPMREFSTMSEKWNGIIEPELTPADQTFLSDKFVSSFSTAERVRYGTGHSLDDVFDVRRGTLTRIPDAVVKVDSEEKVLELVQAAHERRWCLIPVGGGTNVTKATRCPDRTLELRPVIAVDMKGMNRILSLNEEDGLAHIEAGITGGDLVLELERRGYTMGHEPDSIEFSTLGGWIATKASGMKRGRYGNIEDIVLSTRIVTSRGVLWKGSTTTEIVAGRVAESMDVSSLVLGSEGSLGIISSAVVRVWPIPDVRKFDSIIFPCFDDGLRFMRSLSKNRPGSIPASVRLLDNAHFRLGQALRPDESSMSGKIIEVVTKVAKHVTLRNLNHHALVCATIGYEGSRDEVIAQEAAVKRISQSHGGIHLGSRVGKAGYDLTFMIAYLRDFALTYHVCGESFETFVPWSKIDRLIPATKQRIREEHQKRLLPGVPFIGCRVTQIYHEGACLYFYLCIGFDGLEDASEVYNALDAAARDEILKQGGSLSHHHGIGKKRATQLDDRMSKAFGETLRGIKAVLDEQNIFGARNGPYA